MPESKERLINIGQIEQNKPILVDTDIHQRVEVPKEVKTWLEQLEMDPTQQKTVNDSNGQPLLQIPAAQDPRVKLPTTRTKFVDGFKKGLDDAGRWFSAFIFRVIKINKGKVKFEEE